MLTFFQTRNPPLSLFLAFETAIFAQFSSNIIERSLFDYWLFLMNIIDKNSTTKVYIPVYPWKYETEGALKAQEAKQTIKKQYANIP